MKSIYSKSHIAAVLFPMMFCFNSVEVQAISQIPEMSLSLPQDLKKGEFKHGQYVIVKLKNGKEAAAKIDGRKGKNKYFVDQIGGRRYGIVHKKYIRPMTEEELAKFKKNGSK